MLFKSLISSDTNTSLVNVIQENSLFLTPVLPLNAWLVLNCLCVWGLKLNDYNTDGIEMTLNIKLFKTLKFACSIDYLKINKIKIQTNLIEDETSVILSQYIQFCFFPSKVRIFQFWNNLKLWEFPASISQLFWHLFKANSWLAPHEMITKHSSWS